MVQICHLLFLCRNTERNRQFQIATIHIWLYIVSLCDQIQLALGSNIHRRDMINLVFFLKRYRVSFDSKLWSRNFTNNLLVMRPHIQKMRHHWCHRQSIKDRRHQGASCSTRIRLHFWHQPLPSDTEGE